MSATILFWRHGQTDYNAQGRLQGQVDIPLNEVGRAQALAAAPALSQIEPVAIISSDLMRARDTAEYLAERTGVAVSTDARLRERNFGAWEGLTHEEMRAGWADAFAVWRDGGHPAGIGAETRSALGQRVAQAAAEASAGYEEGGVVVLVAHGAAISAGLVALLGHDPETWHGITGIGNCHWSVVRPNDGAEPGWRMTAHNAGGGLVDFPQGARIV
ncbi:histidine phosphatase family protein [Pseudactinotalea sp. Z1732]|uniref:histidine phosphatase family protein n=1 Tax=Pseudactinotalea sp. Z1732 TaxID=3413026 RepID=UPI003C7E9C9E